MGEGSAPEPAVLVGLPEPLDRRMRLGPFPSVRHALKFAVYCSVAVVAATTVGPIWSLPLFGGGFVLSAYQSEGKGLDGRLVDRVAFHVRARRGATMPRRWPKVQGPYLTCVRGRLLAIVKVGGVPVAFLPPQEARGLFERYRRLLDQLDGGICLTATLEPLAVHPLPSLESQPLPGSSEAAARSGYIEMSGLLCRRRRRRAVYLVLWTDTAAEGAALRLDRSVTRLEEGLRQLGLAPQRLRDRRLSEAAARMGWWGGSPS